MPKKWERLPVDAAKLKAVLKANPELGVDPDKPPTTQLQAYATDGSGANMNVIATSSGNAALDAVEKDYANQLRALKPTNIVTKRVRTAAGEVLRGSYTMVIQTPNGPLTTPNFADAIGRTLYRL